MPGNNERNWLYNSWLCGKQPITASLQDLLVYTVKGVAAYSSQLRKIISIDEILKTADRLL